MLFEPNLVLYNFKYFVCRCHVGGESLEMVMAKKQERAKIPIRMEIGMLVLGRTMSGRGTELYTTLAGIGSRVCGQMMPSTVLG